MGCAHSSAVDDGNAQQRHQSPTSPGSQSVHVKSPSKKDCKTSNEASPSTPQHDKARNFETARPENCLLDNLLDTAKLPQYREALTRAGYEDIDSLADLDWSDFEKIEGFTGVAIPPGHRKRLMAAAQRLCPEAAGRVPFSDAPAAAWSHDSPPQQQQDSPGLLPVAMGGAERPLAAAATAGDLQFFGLGPPAGQARSGGGGAQQSAALKAAQRFALPGSLGSSGELAAPQSGQSPPSSPLGQQSAGVASRAQRPDAPQPQGGRGRAQHASQKENSPSAARGREQAARSAAEATAAAASKGNAEAAARGAFPAVAVFGPKLPPLAPAEQDRAGGARPRPEPAAHAPTATPQQQQQQRWVSPSEGRPPPGAQPDPARADAQQKAIAELHLGLQQRVEELRFRVATAAAAGARVVPAEPSCRGGGAQQGVGAGRGRGRLFPRGGHSSPAPPPPPPPPSSSPPRQPKAAADPFAPGHHKHCVGEMRVMEAALRERVENLQQMAFVR